MAIMCGCNKLTYGLHSFPERKNCRDGISLAASIADVRYIWAVSLSAGDSIASLRDCISSSGRHTRVPGGFPRGGRRGAGVCRSRTDLITCPLDNNHTLICGRGINSARRIIAALPSANWTFPCMSSTSRYCILIR